ncbi:cytochrome c maturation protein CcmE [Deinococcus pimensis]|uniref:cytochrome c maturation protein CcmE n=1 Tax=Deinococcus pimensis TaxID=309888 RepID=UPI0004856342|nr:cytochrome c maturation protein CcmE [Deinococcus pimensis]
MDPARAPAPLAPARRRRRSPWPYVVALVALLGVAGAMLYGSLNQNIVFFVTPSEYREAVSKYEHRTLRLGGLVENETYDPQSQLLRFTITDGGARYPVRYVGAIPDLFRQNQGVVVEGRFENGTFEARQLLVKHSEEYAAPKSESDAQRLLHDTR